MVGEPNVVITLKENTLSLKSLFERINIKKVLEIIESIGSKPVLASSFIFIFASAIVIGLTLFKYSYDENFLKNILIEAHGMLFDILVIGVFVFALHRLGEKRLKRRLDIERYEDEIDDLRFWKSEEATFRIVGNIRRLNRYGVTDINLHACYMRSASLLDAQLQEAQLTNVNLQSALLYNAQFQGAIFLEANLREANLGSANFQKANIYEVNFSKAILGYAKFKDASIVNSNLKGTIELTVEQLSKAKTLYNTELDKELMEKIEKEYPHLLDKPKEEK